MHAVYRLTPFVSVKQTRPNLIGADSLGAYLIGVLR